MAKFDMIFLLKYLAKIGHIKPVIHNGRFISVDLTSDKVKIKFRDSYLLLLASLNKLCKAFKVKTPKTQFPILFLIENSLEYEGILPDIKFFKSITFEEYNEYKNSFNNEWNLKKESTKYCENDCISLYQVITNFSILIYDLFQKDMHRFPTLPSLAFGIFKTKFMEEENIPQLTGKIEEHIRASYTGGAVDMYIPENPNGTKVYAYDVNSLYPAQMQSQLMPVGVPKYFEGDITKMNPDAFGFFYCKIKAPDNILHPILQTHVKTSNGTRTISPIGTWNNMLFSKELMNARKFGYEIEILWGYTFESANIFKDYVDLLYNLRLQYPKSHPMNFIAKILLNSLYGRFGMDDNFAEKVIIQKDYYPDFENKYLDKIIDKIDLDSHWLIFFESDEDQEELEHNVSIGISAAITAYSRVHMSQFKNNPDINLYYTDTDSIYTDSEIDSKFVDTKVLGKLKLESTSEKVVFLSPKVYCLNTIDDGLIYKVKGLKHEIELTMNDFEKLLYKESILKKMQTKFMRNLSEGNIKLLDQMYTLQVTDNKRKLIYDNNKWVDTEAYKFSETKDIRNI